MSRHSKEVRERSAQMREENAAMTDAPRDELEPCPFCGVDLTRRDRSAFHPENDCWLATAADHSQPYELENYDYAAWNRRHRAPSAPPSSPPQTETAFDDLLAINEQSSKAFFEMRRVLLMALQLAYSGNHDGKNDACPTCHVVKEARKIGIVFDAETGEPLG